VTAVRNQSPAAQAKVQAGDIIDQVEVTDAAGKKVRYVTLRSQPAAPAGITEKPLDPERLPFELEQWAEHTPGDREVTLTVLRTNPLPQAGDPDAHKERQRVSFTLRWDDSWRFNKEMPLGQNWPMSIAELGIAYRVESTVEDVEPNSPAAEQGIQRGDIVKEARFYNLGKKKDDEINPDKWVTLQPNQWSFMHIMVSARESPKVDFRLLRNKDEVTVSLESVEDRTWPMIDRGLNVFLMKDTYLQKADSWLQAMAMGFDRTASFIVQIYGNLRGFSTGRISPTLMAGPPTIAAAAFSFAQTNIYEFLTFLGIISVNLAVINFLPIPILDGGHMVFLIYEKLRGQPASEQVRLAATYLGLALLICLMIFVLYLDVKRYI
jgi:regulator of sigma E protease